MQWRSTRRRQQIAAYARQVAGTAEDLDPELERASIESLTDERCGVARSGKPN
jgi:hypothetical protein